MLKKIRLLETNSDQARMQLHVKMSQHYYTGLLHITLTICFHVKKSDSANIAYTCTTIQIICAVDFITFSKLMEFILFRYCKCNVKKSFLMLISCNKFLKRSCSKLHMSLFSYNQVDSIKKLNNHFNL